MNWKKDFVEQFYSETADCCAWHSNFELQLFITKLIQEIIEDIPDSMELKKQLKKKYL